MSIERRARRERRCDGACATLTPLNALAAGLFPSARLLSSLSPPARAPSPPPMHNVVCCCRPARHGATFSSSPITLKAPLPRPSRDVVHAPLPRGRGRVSHLTLASCSRWLRTLHASGSCSPTLQMRARDVLWEAPTRGRAVTRSASRPTRCATSARQELPGRARPRRSLRSSRPRAPQGRR